MEFKINEQTIEIIEKPLTAKEVLERVDEFNNLEVNIIYDFNDAIDTTSEEFFDALSEAVVGNCCLMEINYSIVGAYSDTQVIMKVSGSVDYYIDDFVEKVEKGE